jgi:BirA family biotin operon repressor/biotin-[acetyl-CoA-carboxylase] ligase
MTLPAPFHLEERGRIDSTNIEARRLVLQGAKHGTVVTAVEQTEGRGRRGREWMSPPGNLHCSFLLDPGPDFTLAPQLTFVAALALRDALAQFSTADFRVKWPNDVLCGGAKIAGILLEEMHGLVIVGVGVNIVAHPRTALYPATDLRAAGCDASIRKVLTAFCEHLGQRYEQWRQGGFEPIRLDWMAVAAGQGDKIVARLANGRELHGTFVGLAADGALELLDAYGITHRVLAGDIFFAGTEGHHAAGD